jgi:hypothetical protein
MAKLRKAYQMHDLDNFAGTDSGVDGDSRYSHNYVSDSEGTVNVGNASKEGLLKAFEPGSTNAKNAFPLKSWGTAAEAKTDIALKSAAHNWDLASTEVTWELLDANTVAYTIQFANDTDQNTFLTTIANNDDGGEGAFGVIPKTSSDKFNW